MTDPDIPIAIMICVSMFVIAVARAVFMRRRRHDLSAGQVAFRGPFAGSIPIAAIGLPFLMVGLIQKCPPENVVCDGPLMLVASGFFILILAAVTHLFAMIVAFAIIRD